MTNNGEIDVHVHGVSIDGRLCCGTDHTGSSGDAVRFVRFDTIVCFSSQQSWNWWYRVRFILVSLVALAFECANGNL